MYVKSGNAKYADFEKILNKYLEYGFTATSSSPCWWPGGIYFTVRLQFLPSA